jgi:hypothetical protein
MADSDPINSCECGCGKPTRPKRRFVKGHQSRHAPTYQRKSYVCRGTGAAKVDVHRLRAEQALGHPLPKGAVVHHPDEDPWNPTARLVICDQAYHKLLHLRMRVKAAGGNPNTDKICGRCQIAKDKAEFSANKAHFDGLEGYCRSCRSAYSKARCT